MNKQIPIKKFRTNLATVAKDVENGAIYTVIRRSEPSFKVVPISFETEGEWETIIDFTEKGKTKGVKIKDALKALKDLNRTDGQN